MIGGGSWELAGFGMAIRIAAAAARSIGLATLHFGTASGAPGAVSPGPPDSQTVPYRHQLSGLDADRTPVPVSGCATRLMLTRLV